MNKQVLVAAAIAGLLGGSVLSHAADKPTKPMKNRGEATGECHGVNSCTGKGECGGEGHECAGKNTCKGKGWIKKTAKECKKLNGTFKA